MQSPLFVVPTTACDRLAYMAARLSIGDWADARNFQPLLYVDADILFDLPVEPMLWAVARSDRISAPVEQEPLAGSVFVGSYLLHADDCSPGTRLGFNSGTLGIPNLQRSGRTLELIGRVMHNRATFCGRDGMPYADQPIANYVLYRLDAVDTALISPYVRLVNHEADPADRCGLVHYCWVAGADVRARLMRSYLQKLAALSLLDDAVSERDAG
jgi:hypothetical protein